MPFKAHKVRVEELVEEIIIQRGMVSGVLLSTASPQLLIRKVPQVMTDSLEMGNGQYNAIIVRPQLRES